MQKRKRVPMFFSASGLGGKNFRRRQGALRGMLAAAALTLILAVFIARGALMNVLWSVAAPLSWPLHALALPIVSGAALQAENATLKAELADARAADADRTALAAQNSVLKTMLAAPDTPLPIVLAPVIAHPPQTPYDTIIVEAGDSNGIAQGDIAGAGALALGFVSATSASFARVTLFSAPDESINAMLDNAPVVLKGQGGASFTAQVPAQIQVVPGDSASIDGISPRTVATVVSVQSTPSGQGFKVLQLSSPTDLFSLQNIEIWREQLPAAVFPEQSAGTTRK